MKRLLIFCIVLLLALSAAGCRAVEPISLPERTPLPTEAPSPTPAPTPEPTEKPVEAPHSIEELGDLIGMTVYPPYEPLEGYALSSLGFDGDKTGALQYTAEGGGSLVFTLCRGTDTEGTPAGYPITICGIEVTLISEKNDPAQLNAAYWTKNGNTYRLIADPCLTEEQADAAVTAMIQAPQNAQAPSVEVFSRLSLEDMVGFPVNAPEGLPEKYTTVHIYALYGHIPIQTYSCEDTVLTYIKSEGMLYPPRFSNIDYASAGEYQLSDGTSVSLFYTENGISLAEWMHGGFGYSITATDPDGYPIDLKKEDFLPLIEGFSDWLTPAEEPQA